MNRCQVCGKEIITSPFNNEIICNDCKPMQCCDSCYEGVKKSIRRFI